MFPVIPANGASQNQIANSLRFRQSASAYLNRTPSVAGSRTTWTFSVWLKRGILGANKTLLCAGSASNQIFFLSFGSDDKLYIHNGLQGTSTESWGVTSQVFRDPSSWYHIVVAMNTTQATAANRVILYVNGVQSTLNNNSANYYPSQNYATAINNTVSTTIGYGFDNVSTSYTDGYMAEVNFIDGQALTPSSFGSINATTGVWQPARYTGSYGTNGFYIKFNNGTSTTTLGNDSSGNGNNWTTNNISLTAGSTYDWMIDSPTSYAGSSYGVGNYAVLNPLDTNSGVTLSNANLTATVVSNLGYSSRCSFGVSSGKWYCEVLIQNLTNVGVLGITTAKSNLATYTGGDSYGFGYINTGVKITNAASSSYGATWVSNDIIGMAFDADAGTLAFYKNNASQGVAFTGLTSGPYFFTVGNGACAYSVNFGQRPFAYTPPSGFKSLCTQNLPAPTIVKGSAHMNAVLDNGYAGVLTANGTIAAGSYANWLCIANDGTSVYVSNSTGASLSLYQRNISTGALTANGSISSGGGGVCISVDGTSVYSVGGSSVYLYQRNTSTGALTSNSTIAAGTSASQICISADGTSVYATNSGSGTVSLYQRNTSTGALTANSTIATGSSPYGICISSDGASVYVANYSSNTISLYQRNTSTGALTSNGTIACSNGPFGICISSDGTSVYAVTYNTTYQIALYQRNTSTGNLTANGTMSTTSGSQSVAISSDGLSVYVPGNNASTTTIYIRDTSTGSLTSAGTISSGVGSTGVCVASNGTSVYVANHSDNTVSLYQRATTGIKTTSQALYTYYLEWIKDRANVNNHQLADTVRGNTAILQSNTTAVETTYTAPSGNSVGWVWNANAAAVTNTAGSITSSVSANPTAGFSVVTFPPSGSGTVGHGLGIAPSLIITKSRTDNIQPWLVYHSAVGPTVFLILNTTSAATTNSTVWNNTAPTSSVFTAGSGTTLANYGTSMVAYCFAAIAGYSAFGSYTGNGSSDGPFLYFGFRPRFVLIKNSSSTSDWYIWDSGRNPTNDNNLYALFPDLSDAQSSGWPMDLVANGFKIRYTGQPNTNGATYIYAAFAENPFQNSLAR